MIEKIIELEKKSDGLILLLPALISCILTCGLYNSPIFAWLYIIFTYRYVMYNKKLKDRYAFLFVFIITYIAANIKWFNILTGVPLWAHLIAFAVISLWYTVPFFITKKIIKYLPDNIIRNFVFPCMWVIFDYLISFLFVGTVLSIAVSQYEFLSLTQICSITGLYGISFLICFIASIVNDFWDNNFKFNAQYRKRIIFGVCLLLAVLVFGATRLSVTDISNETIRTASITHGYGNESWDDNDPVKEAAMFTDEKFNENLQNMERDIKQTINTNTKCINWPEEGFPVASTNYDKMVEYCKGMAKKYNIFLFVPIDYHVYEETEKEGLGSNILLLFDDQGNLQWRYDKCNLVPIYETGVFQPGDGVIHSTDIEGSKFAGVICFDAYYPTFINQISKVDVDVLMTPSYEWKSISTYSGYGTSFRSIENGCSYIRNADDGLLIANGPYGRQLEYFQNYDTKENIVFVDVPKYGVKTFYGIFGDWLIWACFLYLIAMSICILCRKKINKKIDNNEE